MDESQGFLQTSKAESCVSAAVLDEGDRLSSQPEVFEAVSSDFELLAARYSDHSLVLCFFEYLWDA